MFDRNQNKRRPGRPKKSNRDKKTLYQMNLKLSEEDSYRLGYVAGKWGMTKQDIVRQGIENIYELARYVDKPPF